MFIASLVLASSFIGRARAQCAELPSSLPGVDDLEALNTLPDPFTFYNGTPLSSVDDWACRQQEIKTLVQHYFYGYYPDTSDEVRVSLRPTVTAKLSSGWQGQTLAITIASGGKSSSFNATLSLPSGASADAPVPAIITLGGFGPSASGTAAVSFDAASVAYDGPLKTGAFWDLYEGDIGVLAAWGWGFSKIIDALEAAVPEVDIERIAVSGCSRYGKAALAAGFFDERVTLTVPMSSGLMGMAPFRFQYEESGANEQLSDMDDTSSSWPDDTLVSFRNDPARLPVDSNFVTAGVAPRALIWDEGTTDYWTNPEGTAAVTFPATLALYEWLGAGENVGIALRNSGHCDPSGNTNVADFINKVFFGTETDRDYHDISPFTAHEETFPFTAPQ
ncbi:carbohydrate esterase family 15 protein [Schizophyllum commune Loenen D]|nr:carbohydrate esterase family 15 protein [Schizophyllum commune Loenen D]